MQSNDSLVKEMTRNLGIVYWFKIKKKKVKAKYICVFFIY